MLREIILYYVCKKISDEGMILTESSYQMKNDRLESKLRSDPDIGSSSATAYRNQNTMKDITRILYAAELRENVYRIQVTLY